jgi:NAD-dependent DNA ligase
MEKIKDLQECYTDAIKEGVEYLHKIISMANTTYYEGDGTMELLSDAEYDKYCKQYIELNKMLGKEIELRSCSFFRVEYTYTHTIHFPQTTDTVEYTNTGSFGNTI